MKQTLITIWLSIILTVSFPLASFSQAKAELLLPDSKVVVRGISSMHDWDVTFGKYNVDFSFSNGENGRLAITNVKAVFSGASVTSENSIMTGKARDALMVKDHPDIVFTSDGADNVINNNGEVSGTIKGKLLLAGTARPIVLSFSGRLNGETMSITGSEEIDMTEYGIKPPTALLGALKTGGKVTVELSLNFLIPGSGLGSN